MAALFAVDADTVTNQHDCTQSLETPLRQLKDILNQQQASSREFPRKHSGMSLLK